LQLGRIEKGLIGMPTYSFKNTRTGEEYQDFMSWKQRQNYLKDYPHIEPCLTTPALVGDHLMGVGPSVDNGFKENMSRIAEAHPHSPLAERYGNNRTIAQKKVDSVVKKHGLNKVK